MAIDKRAYVFFEELKELLYRHNATLKVTYTNYEVTLFIDDIEIMEIGDYIDCNSELQDKSD